MAVEAIRIDTQRFQIGAAKHKLRAEQKERSKRPLVARERIRVIEGVGRGLSADKREDRRGNPAEHEDRQPNQQYGQPVTPDHDACD